MSRVRFVLAAGASVFAVALGTAIAGAATPPRDELRAFTCQRALDPPARAVSIQAVMRPLSGTNKMQMRFQLMRQTRPGARFKLVRGRLLGSWVTPDDPTLGQRPGDVWIVNHPVVNLAAPATYRFRVSFRWLDAHGKQLGSADQTSATCYQPELRADLIVRSLAVRTLPSGADAYVAEIANRGRTGAGPFQVQFAGVGKAPQSATISRLAARSFTRQTFVAPACTPGSNLTVTVDPSHSIDESSFANNVLTMPCPSPAAPSS
jgi:hypothetical protein